MDIRNPFRLRKAEQISSENRFHYLYGYRMLQMLDGKNNTLWDRLQIIRSAPGGGKTTLLRLFTVESLLAICKYNNRSEEHFSKLYEIIESLGAIEENSVNIIGVYLSCSSPYSAIEDLDIDEKRRDRLFFALLNARALMGVLKSICDLKALKYPQGLNSIEIKPDNNDRLFFSTYNGMELYEKAKQIEHNVIQAIDSVNYSYDNLTGISDLFLWAALEPGVIKCDGTVISKKILFMLDDVHDLSNRQRSLLLKELEAVYPTARWIAERYESIGTEDALYTASTKGREYELYRIEEWAFDNKTKTLFHKGLAHIADRRVATSKYLDTFTFDTLLEEDLEKKYFDKCKKAITDISNRIQQILEEEKRFNSWFIEVMETDNSPLIKATNLRMLEVLIKRKMQRGATLFPDFELPVEEFANMQSAAVNNAAKLFLSKDYSLPYYYGLDTLQQISSGNVEQFLEVTGDIFDEVLAAYTIKRKEPTISVFRQESIIKKASKNRFEQIPIRMISGRKIYNLIDNIGAFCARRTYEETAPYAPGVTGIAISWYEANLLSDDSFLLKNSKHRETAEVLREAIANNILEPRPRQHCKGKDWLVLYLNRLLCVNFGLPLEYGGWKEQSLDTVLKWLSPPERGLFD